MPRQDGFLTHLTIEKGYKYTQLKWLWIAVSAICGMAFGILTWFYDQKLVFAACATGTLFGGALFFLYLKTLPEKIKGK